MPDRPDAASRLSDQRFRLLVESVADHAISMLDPEGRVASWNAGAERATGHAADEIVGADYSRFFTGEDCASDLPARALRIAAREGRHEMEGWRVRKDGSRFWANAVLEAIRDADGRLLGFAEVTRDITSKKETERALRESEQRFQLLVDSVTDYAIYMLDREGHVVTWNSGARRFKGYAADEIVGEHFSRFFTPADRKGGLPARILRTAAAEGRFEAEGRRVRKDGSHFLAHVVVDAIRNPDGEVVGFAKVTRDITERHERERALFRSEQQFRMLVQGVRDYAIYLLDRDGRVTNWNSGAEVIKGYREQEIVGSHFSRFYTEEDKVAGEPARALRVALAEGKYEKEGWRVRKDGSLFWANVVIDPIFDEAGEHVGFAKITRDATDRKRAAEALEEARAAIAQSQKLQALGELTGGIAHDFNNLMTVIAGSAELLLRRPDLPDEKRRHYLEAIAETTRRATTLTSHLLAFGRRQPIRPQVLDLNVRLDAFAEMLSRTLDSRIEVVLDLRSGRAHVEVDPAELETALLNAAFNARDAMPDGGRLTISTVDRGECDAPMVCLGIADTGTGMPAAVVERAFEPFFTTKEVGKGTGLGLSQIHGFAAQAGGRAEIRSGEGEGTTVTILLPRSDKKLSAAPDDRTAAGLPRGLRILLVEDNDQVREFAETLLAELHCAVTVARDGTEAIALLDAHGADLLFSDVVMPGISGVELARLVRARHPALPILLASGYSEEIIGDAAAEFPVIAKPYGAEVLTAAIARLLPDHRDQAA